MSAPQESNGRPEAPPDQQSILANLPRTRPQRSTPRREAARGAGTPTGRSTSKARAAQPSGAAAEPAQVAVSANGAGEKTAPRRSAGTRKRAAARAGSSARARTGAKAAKTRPARAPKARRAGVAEEPVPAQGYDSEPDRARGPVQPPGGAELMGAAAEIFGEIAKAGLSTGERLVRDAIARLPLG